MLHHDQVSSSICVYVCLGRIAWWWAARRDGIWNSWSVWCLMLWKCAVSTQKGKASFLILKIQSWWLGREVNCQQQQHCFKALLEYTELKRGIRCEGFGCFAFWMHAFPITWIWGDAYTPRRGLMDVYVYGGGLNEMRLSVFVLHGWWIERESDIPM